MEDLFSSKAALFGRLREEVLLNPLSRDAAKEFLRRGFEQEGQRVKEEEISDAVEQLDGLVGWLTYYGYLRKSLEHGEALMRIKKDAKTLLSKELADFLDRKKGEKRRYILLLKALSLRHMGWQELLQFLQVEEKKRISKSRLKAYLDALMNHGFVVKKEERYRLADPLLALLFGSA
jgi:AAA+ ATPase superfamily predicted ATPase